LHEDVLVGVEGFTADLIYAFGGEIPVNSVFGYLVGAVLRTYLLRLFP